MPPRITLSVASPPPRSLLSSISPFLLPSLLLAPRLSCRHASVLSSLSDNPSAYAHVFRRGRGPSSGKGKTSGRGHKGQKAHGKVPRGFNGGQTPLEIVHGKRGAVNVFATDMQVVNLSKITGWIAQGRLDPLKPITIRELAISKCVSNIKEGVKLLAHGSEAVRYPIDIVVSRASGAAIAAIEEAGGSVLTRYYTPLAVRRIIGGTMDPVVSLWSAKRSVDGAAEASADKSVGFRYRLPDPTSRKDIEYYRDPAHRGYLSHTVAPGEGPSLFFRAPGTGIDRKRLRVAGPGKSKAESVENRLW